jgi:hypothetical protein
MSRSSNQIFSDAEVERLVIGPAGGLSAFSLKACPGFKLVQYTGQGGTYDFSIEDDTLAQAVVEYLERMGVPEMPAG